MGYGPCSGLCASMSKQPTARYISVRIDLLGRLSVEDFTWIQNSVWIELVLDSAHQIDTLSMFDSKTILVAKPNSVLAGDRSANVNCFTDDPAVDSLSAIPFVGIISIGKHESVK